MHGCVCARTHTHMYVSIHTMRAYTHTHQCRKEAVSAVCSVLSASASSGQISSNTRERDVMSPTLSEMNSSVGGGGRGGASPQFQNSGGATSSNNSLVTETLHTTAEVVFEYGGGGSWNGGSAEVIHLCCVYC